MRSQLYIDIQPAVQTRMAVPPSSMGQTEGYHEMVMVLQVSSMDSIGSMPPASVPVAWEIVCVSQP